MFAEPIGNSENGSLATFLEEVRQNQERTHAELTELDLLIKQSESEVERLALRNAQVISHIRHLEANFDTVPRADLRDGYQSLQNAQQRLFAMRGQLEKLVSDRGNLQRLDDFQRRLLQFNDLEGAMAPSTARRRGEQDQSPVVAMIEAQEAERRRLVRRMHDGPASAVSNFILQAEICRRSLDIDPARATSELRNLEEAATATFNMVKDFIFELRPMMLDDLGLAPTLRRYSEALAEKSGTPIRLSLSGGERRVEGHIEVTAFRAVQALLNQARLQRPGGEIDVRLEIAPDRVTVVVQDDGADAGAPGEPAQELSAIREQVEMLGGGIEVESRPGQGRRTEITIPVEGN